MTPIAGFIIAIIAGWLVPGGRRAATVVVIPWMVVFAGQTWGLAAGLGTSPPSTVTQLPGAIGYYLLNAAFLAFALAVAWLLGALRAHRPGRAEAAADARRRAAIASGVLSAAAVVFVIVLALTSAPVHHHLATGRPPAVGFIGMGLELLAVIALGAATVTRRRSTAAPDIPPGGRPVTTAGRQ